MKGGGRHGDNEEAAGSEGQRSAEAQEGSESVANADVWITQRRGRPKVFGPPRPRQRERRCRFVGPPKPPASFFKEPCPLCGKDKQLKSETCRDCALEIQKAGKRSAETCPKCRKEKCRDSEICRSCKKTNTLQRYQCRDCGAERGYRYDKVDGRCMACEKKRRRKSSVTFNCLNCRKKLTRHKQIGVGKLGTPRESFRFCSRRCSAHYRGKHSRVEAAARTSAVKVLKAQWRNAFRVIEAEQKAEQKAERLLQPEARKIRTFRVLPPITCARCGKDFVPATRKAKCCSLRCYRAIGKHLGYLYRGIAEEESRRLFMSIVGSVHRVHSELDKLKKELKGHGGESGKHDVG